MIMGKFRNYINKKFIESNPVIGEVLSYQNRIYGRRRSVFSRAALDLQLYIKYVLLRRHLLEEQAKNRNKAVYPESQMNQKQELEAIMDRLDQNDTVTFDMWGVLFYEILNEQQLAALAEARLHYIGLSDMENMKKSLSSEQIQCIDDIRLDFIMQNDRMNDLMMSALQHGKKIYVYNNSDYSDQFAQRVLARYSCCAGLTPILQAGMHVTNKICNMTDVMYKDVRIQGERYRPFYHINAVTALYNQIVNIKFHSQDKEYPLFYEYGFAYGGILTCGFCQFLDRLAESEGADKLIFVARDGDIMEKVYKKYFGHIDTSYLVFSRFASYELIFDDFPEEYIDKNIKPRIGRQGADNSVKKILQECGLERLEKYLDEEGISPNEPLHDENYLKIKSLILRHRSDLSEIFAETGNASREYIMGKIGTSKKVCIVDLGWHGKSIVYLKHLCEKCYGWDGEVMGALLGASENDVVQDHIRTGLIHTYAFENEYWRSMGTRVGKRMEYKECICLEALFSSTSSTLLRYTYNADGHISFVYGKKNKNIDKIAQIHEGVLDFVGQFMPLIQKYNLKITERDAYTPVDSVMRNPEYQDLIYRRYYEEPNAMNGF